MSYTVLARRYRSGTFDEVIGQESIARTLLGAIATSHVAHAYLFAGTRGVGKTTTARLFARALNAPDTIPGCPKLGEQAEGGDDFDYPPPDVQQRMAEAIMRGEDLNVIELDGASNRGIDDARDIIAKAGMSPTGQARFKVYIIDEVHQLTKEAFNALLKTMEEPPQHVKFILCTTEPQKVPATIQSRCQRYDFRNIPTARIAEHLKAVLEKEDKKANEDVIWQVARLGNGSMRDALSLLDRLIATGQQPLTADILEQMLGLPPEELVAALVEAIAQGDAATALRRTNDLVLRGIAEEQLALVLIEHLRHLMLVSVCGVESELVELSAESRQAAAEQARHFDAAALAYMITLCENLHQAARQSSNPRALLDVTMVRLALAEKMADVAALLAGDGAKKKEVATVAADAPHAAPARPSPRPSPQAAGASEASEPASRTATPSAAPAPAPDRSDHPPTPTPTQDKPRVTSDDPATVWSAVLASVRQRAALSWVQTLRLERLEGGAAYLTHAPGRRHMRHFIADRQRQQLADLLRPIIGRPVRVEVIAPDAAPHDEPDAPLPPPRPEAGDAALRRDAAELPLVKQVMKELGAAMVGARREAPDDAPQAEPHTDPADDATPL